MDGMEDDDEDEAWLSSGNVEFLGSPPATCIHDTPCTTTDDMLSGATRSDAQTLRECHDRAHALLSIERPSKQASERCISVFLYFLFCASLRVVKIFISIFRAH